MEMMGMIFDLRANRLGLTGRQKASESRPLSIVCIYV